MIQEEPFAQPVPSKRVKTRHDHWKFGPEATAQSAIEFFTFFHGPGYFDNGP